MTSMIDEINNAFARFEASRTVIFCTPAKYDQLLAALEETPDLAGYYRLVASPILTDDDQVLVYNGEPNFDVLQRS